VEVLGGNGWFSYGVGVLVGFIGWMVQVVEELVGCRVG